MAGECDEAPLSELADLSGGFAFKSEDYAPSGRFILRTLNIRDDCSIDRADAVWLPEEMCSQYSRFELEEHDTLFVMVGATLGKVGYVRKTDLPALLNQNMWRVRARKNVAYPRFVHYAFRQAVKANLGWASGSARDFVRRDDYRNMPISAPPLPDQRAIDGILGALDDKIDLNRRMNETLESMARAIFKSWFVDFDPVRAKMDSRRPFGMDPETAALFPDSFQDSELGEIPRGWSVVPIPDAIAVNPARALRKGNLAPYLDMANMPTQGHTPDTVIDRPLGSGMRFVNGDTLVARITPCLENGKTAYVDFLADGQVGWGSTEYIVLCPKHPLPSEFAYCLARSPEFREFAIQSMTGTSGRQRVPPDALSHYLLAIPSDAVAIRFGKVARPLFAQASHAARESRTLAAIRDALLPKLMSGEIRVRDAEKMAAAV